jgi:hypothetical protein
MQIHDDNSDFQVSRDVTAPHVAAIGTSVDITTSTGVVPIPQEYTFLPDPSAIPKKVPVVRNRRIIGSAVREASGKTAGVCWKCKCLRKKVMC